MNLRHADADFSLAAGGSMGNALLDKLATMRASDPIYWSEANKLWIVTGHKEVVEGFRGHLPLSAVRLPKMIIGAIPEDERMTRVPYLMESLPKWIINMDPPGQPRLRRLMMKAFSRKVAEDIRPFARQVIAEVLDRLAAKGDVEFVKDASREIPQRIILRLMGLPDDYREMMSRWVATTTPTLGNAAVAPEQLERCEAVLLEMRENFAREIRKRRDNPTEDFISSLVTARDEGDQLTEEEMLGICYVTLLAGHNTTANTLAMGTAALAANKQARDFMRANPDKALDNVMELMRYIAMSIFMARVAIEDFDWNGHKIQKGQFVMLMIAGANRDPAVFAEPDRLDMTRPQDANMTFAPGLHFCIGHYLAKMQLIEFFASFLARFELEMLGAELDFGPSLAFRGLESLHLRLRPL
jgi:cytochrome P450